MSERAEILYRAIEVIEDRGWKKAPVDGDLEVCLTEAVNIAQGGDRTPWAASYPILGHDHERYVSGMPDGDMQRHWPWVWNDRFGTCERVIEILRFLADTGMTWDDAIDLWLLSQPLPKGSQYLIPQCESQVVA